MSKKVTILMAAILLLGFLLAGCNMSASTPPAFTATSPAEFPFPVQSGTGEATGATQTPGEKGAIEMTPQSGGGVIATPIEGQPTVEETAPAEGEQAGGGVPVEQPTEAPAAPFVSNVQLPTVTRPSSYTLLRGEFPYCIARRFDLPVSTLLSMNNLGVNSKPPAGTVLSIPQSGTWNSGTRALRPHPSTYTVGTGDSVNSIACYYGDVDPSAIIALNGLQPPYSLTTGQTLQIP